MITLLITKEPIYYINKDIQVKKNI